jgi:hypothetical protein
LQESRFVELEAFRVFPGQSDMTVEEIMMDSFSVKSMISTCPVDSGSSSDFSKVLTADSGPWFEGKQDD